jgi:ATP-binding cassette subfamily F protein 2
MPSDAAKKRAAKKKEARDRKTAEIKRSASGTPSKTNDASVEAAAASVTALSLAEARTCTGVLTSHPMSRDVHISSFSLSFHGLELLNDTKLELNWGRRYGLVGLNGCGEDT